MPDTKVVTVKVLGDSSSAQTSFKKVGSSAKDAAGHVTAAGKAAKQTGEHFNKSGLHIASFAKHVATGIVAAAGLTYGLHAAVEGIKEMVNDAVDLEKTQIRVNKLFGSNSHAIIDWAENAAKSMGLSTNQAESAASMFAIFGKTAGLTGKNLVTFSEANTKLAVDLASFKNVDPSLTFKAMNSALAGNYRGLKQFGIVIDSHMVKEQALKMHLIHTTKDALTPRARVLATQTLLMQKASFAEDDFGKHSTSAANKHKILTAEIANVKEKIGTALLPILKKFMDFIGSTIVPGLVKFVNGLTGSGKATDGMTDAGRKARDVLRDMANTIKNAIGWMQQHKTATRNLAFALGALYIAIKLNNAATKTQIALAKAGGLLNYIKQINLVKLATRAWTLVQWLLNAALNANPIGIVIAALAALAVGFVIAYRHSETFRKIVQGAWMGIKIAAKAVSDFMVTYVWPKILWVWNNIGVRIVRLYVAFFKTYFGLIRLVVLGVVLFFKNVLWPVVAWVWTNIGSKTVWLYAHVFKPYFAAITVVVRALIAFFKNVFWPAVVWVWNQISSKVSWLYGKVFKPYFGLIKNVVLAVINFFKRDLVNGINSAMNSVFNIVKKMFGFIRGAFQSGVNSIAKIWGTLTGALKKVVNDVINNVYNKGIKKLWDGVASVLHLPKLPAFQPFADGGKATRAPILAHGLADGGRVYGRGGPRQDMIPAMLSNGEYVVNAKQTQRHGHVLEAINNGRFGQYANGGFAVPAIEALQRAVGPRLRVTSTTSGGHVANSYHYRGEAVDFAGTPRAMDVAAANMMKFAGYILELIHSPKWFVHNGSVTGRSTYAAVYANHFGHMHLAMTKQAATQALLDLRSGKIKPGRFGFGPGGLSLPALIASINSMGAAKYYARPYAAAGKLGGGLFGPAYGKGLVDMTKNATAKAVADAVASAQAAQAAAGAFSTTPTNLNFGRMSGQIGSWIGSASHFVNLPASWVRGIRYIMGRESGFNPRAINNTDINARRGDPSRGLMQTTGSTFKSNHAAGTSWDIYDPIANIAAAVNYIHRKYGSVYNTPWYHGKTYYDQGGWIQPGTTMVQNNTGSPEWLGPGGSGGDIHLHLHFEGPVTGNERQFVRHVLPVFRDEYQKASKRKGSPYFE